MRPGYRTSEHAVTWAVIGLAALALFRDHGSSLAQLAAVLAPAMASAAYSASRGRVKTPPPFDPASDAHRLRQTLGELFRGRIVK